MRAACLQESPGGRRGARRGLAEDERQSLNFSEESGLLMRSQEEKRDKVAERYRRSKKKGQNI